MLCNKRSKLNASLNKATLERTGIDSEKRGVQNSINSNASSVAQTMYNEGKQ